MSNYTKATNFATKDTLPSGNSGKIVKGTEIDDEFNAIASAISSKADTASPSFTGTPAAPTAASGSNTTQIATTAFVTGAVTDERTAAATLTGKTVNLTSNTLTGTVAQFNTALSDGDFATLAGTETLTNKTLTSPVINTPTIASPTISGTPTAPTATAGTNTTQVATTAFVTTAVTNERTASATLTNKTLTSPTISGGTVTGITDLAVADGGTGVSTIAANAVVLGNGTSAIQTVAPGTSGNLLTSNGTTWTSAAAPTPFSWNVTYVNTAKDDDTSYTLPSNCIGVYVWCETYGGGNNGGIGKVTIKNSGGTELGYVYVGGTNIGSGADGGSGMRDGVGTFVPVSSTASTIEFSTITNDVNSSWVVQAYVTKA